MIWILLYCNIYIKYSKVGGREQHFIAITLLNLMFYLSKKLINYNNIERGKFYSYNISRLFINYVIKFKI